MNFTRSKIPPSESQKFLKEFEKWEAKHPEVKLADQQEEAVKAVASHHLSVLTGGPGTGKTTVLKAILDAYRATFPDANVTLLAPTGLAAKRMSEACGFPASTVHKALGLTPSESAEGFDDSNSVGIDGGLVIVDESSMLGIHLMRFLFDSILFSSNTRIVIVGDIDQLPSVSPGAVLDAMISSQKLRLLVSTGISGKRLAAPLLTQPTPSMRGIRICNSAEISNTRRFLTPISLWRLRGFLMRLSGRSCGASNTLGSTKPMS